MIFFVDNRVKARFDFRLKPLCMKLLTAVMEEEAFPYRDEEGGFLAGASLVIAGAETVRDYNRTYRGTDRATDVLSFPAFATGHPGDFCHIREAFDPDTGHFMLGDILISAPHLEKQAHRYGHSLKREAAFLITHSLFHLCGYDHETSAERRVMEEKQSRVLEQLKITR